MNTLLNSLADACRQHPLKEKVLITPSHSAGHALLESLLTHGRPYFNLRVATLSQLAMEFALPHLAEQELTPATPGQLRALLEQELSSMESSGEIKYFAPLRQSADLTAVLLPSLLELRMAGVDSLSPESFVDPQKGHELSTLLTRFGTALINARLADQACIFKVASTASSLATNAIYLIPENLSPSNLEREFLNTLSPLHVLTCEPVLGLNRPEPTFTTPKTTPASPFSYLYDISHAPATDIPLSLFQSYGQHNECREVLRRLRRDSIPFDQVVIACANPAFYIPQFLSLSHSLNIPMTFGEGYSAVYTRPGQLLQGLLRFVESNYRDTELIRILQTGAIKLPSASHCIRTIRKLKLGWGRERYQRLLDLRTAQEPDERDIALAELTACLLTNLPEPTNQSLPLANLCSGLKGIIETYARITSELDGQALSALTSTLAELSLIKGVFLPVHTAVERVERALNSVSVGATYPAPGHLHVCSYTSALWLLRPHTYVVGLDAGNFPGAGLQDPILLDKEREAIGHGLPLLSLRPAQNLYDMAHFLASRRGPVTLSFACYDTVEGRESSPSGLFLQAYRLKHNKPDADYSTLLQSLDVPVSYSTSSCPLSEDEWWLGEGLSGHYRANLHAVTDCYPHLARGIEAERERESDMLTPYDGYVGPAQDAILIASATELEYFAKCPYAYFLRYVLKLYPVDQTLEDTSIWLDAAQRGSLLHEIYCTYMRTVFQGTGQQDKDLLHRVADEAIARYREKTPAPSDLVYEYQRREIHSSLEVFWRVETNLAATPRFFEMPFGMGPDEVTEAGYGMADPVELKLPSGRVIHLRGIMDRVDEVAPHIYEVWDFKTGSTYGYDEHFYLKAGTQMQHALYAWALEEVLRQTGLDPEARVSAGGYLFPTERGEGLRVARPFTGPSRVAAALDALVAIAQTGSFCATHDKTRCRFCDYVPVCGGEIATLRSQAKQDNELNEELTPWKELQTYE